MQGHLYRFNVPAENGQRYQFNGFNSASVEVPIPDSGYVSLRGDNRIDVDWTISPRATDSTSVTVTIANSAQYVRDTDWSTVPPTFAGTTIGVGESGSPPVRIDLVDDNVVKCPQDLSFAWSAVSVPQSGTPADRGSGTIKVRIFDEDIAFVTIHAGTLATRFFVRQSWTSGHQAWVELSRPHADDVTVTADSSASGVSVAPFLISAGSMRSASQTISGPTTLSLDEDSVPSNACGVSVAEAYAEVILK